MVNPSNYANEPWKTHIVDPFDYFADPLKSQLIAKSPRALAPLGGKIDYDVDGKLVGNWFDVKRDINNYANSWKQEISLAYNYIDPSQIQLSLGPYADSGDTTTFGAKGNAPDPKDIGVGQTVKYELVLFKYLDSAGKPWDERSAAKGVRAQNSDSVQGIAPFELTDARKLKAEFSYG